MFNGKEKAWANSVAMFLVALLFQKTNGNPIDPGVVNDFSNLTQELLVSGGAATISWFVTWVTGNSGYVKQETPKEEITIEENPS